jgi:hypothetical protein
MKTSDASAFSEVNIPLWKKRIQELIKLLQQQLNLASQGRIGEVEALVSQSDPVVKQLSEAQVLERGEFKADKQKLEKLYRKIYLALTDRHEGISSELQSIRKGRKTLKAYRGNV